MPGAPADVQREYPGKKARRGVHHNSGKHDQERDVQRDELVFLEVRASVVRAINRGHEVRIIKDNREQIKRHSPAVRVHRAHPHRHTQQRSGPPAAAYQKIEPRTVNPRTRGCGSQRGWPGRCYSDCFDLSAQATNLAISAYDKSKYAATRVSA